MIRELLLEENNSPWPIALGIHLGRKCLQGVFLTGGLSGAQFQVLVEFPAARTGYIAAVAVLASLPSRSAYLTPAGVGSALDDFSLP